MPRSCSASAPCQVTFRENFNSLLGDGVAYLSANPAMLVFLPWLMVSYHAMTMAAFLALRDHAGTGTQRRRPAMFVLPLLALPAVYWIAGGTILVVVRALGWNG